jgi:hypothetical protein
MTSRKNAMLTTEDRRWLSGEKAYEGEHAKQQRYQRRRDIRERVYNSLLDFTILFEHLEGDECQKLFGTPETNYETLTEDQKLTNGVRDALAFVLYNTGIRRTMTHSNGQTEELAEWLLTEGMRRAGQKDDLLVETVELSVEAEKQSQLSLLEDLKTGKDLSPRELRLLLESDEVDTREVQDCIRTLVLDEENDDV